MELDSKSSPNDESFINLPDMDTNADNSTPIDNKPSGFIDPKNFCDITGENERSDDEVERIDNFRAEALRYKEEGNAKYAAKDYYAALDLYNLAIKKDPSNPDYYSNRAATEMMLGLTLKSIESCKKCLEICPTKLKAMLRLGKLQVKLGLPSEALATLNGARKLDSTNKSIISEIKQAELLEQRIKAAREKMRTGDIKHAKALAQAGLRQAPESRELNIIRTRGLISEGDYDQAYGLTTKLMRDNQNDTQLLLCRAQCLYFQENFASATRHLFQALSLDPDNSAAQVEIRKIRKLERLKEKGNEAFKKANWKDAADAYTECLSVDPLNKLFCAKLYCNRATVYQKLHKNDEALSDSDMAISLNPDYGKAHLRRALCLRALGGKDNLERAMHSYSEAERIIGRSHQTQQDIRDTKIELKKSKRKDYYAILDCPQRENATDPEIKKAYRKAALKWHPDRHSNGSEEEKAKAELMFKDLAEAYDVLSNAEKREKYNSGQSLEEIEQGAPNMGGHDPNEIFQMFFGDGGVRGTRFASNGGASFHFG